MSWLAPRAERDEVEEVVRGSVRASRHKLERRDCRAGEGVEASSRLAKSSTARDLVEVSCWFGSDIARGSCIIFFVLLEGRCASEGGVRAFDRFFFGVVDVRDERIKRPAGTEDTEGLSFILRGIFPSDYVDEGSTHGTRSRVE